MKPRWKIVVELIVAVIITLLAGSIFANALEGGPIWNWLAAIVVWKGLDDITSAWKEL